MTERHKGMPSSLEELMASDESFGISRSMAEELFAGWSEGEVVGKGKGIGAASMMLDFLAAFSLLSSDTEHQVEEFLTIGWAQQREELEMTLSGEDLRAREEAHRAFIEEWRRRRDRLRHTLSESGQAGAENDGRGG